MKGIIARVNLGHLFENALEIKKLLNKNTQLCGVIKSNAYGHGALQVANRLSNACSCFAVNSVDEGVLLRLGGIKRDILVLLPCLSALDVLRACKYNLTLSICSNECLKLMLSVVNAFNQKIFVHIKVNTGMNRLGVELEELDGQCKMIFLNQRITCTGVYSHLFLPQNSSESEKQLKKFLSATNICRQYFKNVCAHLSATGGIFNGTRYHLDMVRCGIGLYGYLPFETAKNTLKPVLSLYATALQTRNFIDGGICYGTAQGQFKGKRISTLAFGYDDGIFKDIIMGNINPLCMGLCSFKGDYKRGERVLLFDDVSFLAKQNNVIVYELLCGATKHAEFEYIN